MATITFKGGDVSTAGELPTVGQNAPEFSLLSGKLQRVTPKDYAGKTVVLNIFPSIDTGVCATSVRTFNQRAANLTETIVINVSEDLPFAHNRFCGAEGIENVESLSAFRTTFGKDYGVEMLDGALAGLCARSIVVVSPEGEVLYTELVPDIAQEPNYDAALAAAAG